MNEKLESERTSIEAKMLALGEEAAEIKRQLGNAKASGDYDRRWFAAAESALRFKNIERQRLQNDLNRVKREIVRGNCREQDTRFRDVACRMLPREVFAAILAEVRAA